MIITTALVAIVLGFALGWMLRNATDSTHKRVFEELFSRKLKLADQLRDESIKTLNANRVEMAGFAARFEALDTEIVGLRDSLASTERARALATETLAARDGEIGACREAAEDGVRSSEEAKRIVEAAHLRVASAEHAMDQAYDELMTQAEKLVGTEQTLAAVELRGQELYSELEQRDSALAESEARLERFGLELRSASDEAVRREGEIEELKELVAGIAPLRAVLAERETSLGRFAEELRSAGELAERRDGEIAELQELLAGIAPLRAVLAERETTLGRSEDALRCTSEESARRQTEIDRLDELVAEIAPLRAALASRETALESSGEELRRASEDAARREFEIAELNVLVAGIAPLRARLAEREVELEHSAATLLTGVEEAVRRAAEITELKVLVGELAPLRAQLADRDDRLERSVERELAQRGRLEALAPLADGVPGLRFQLDSLAEHNRALESQLALVGAEAALLPPLRAELSGMSSRADATARALEQEHRSSEEHAAAAKAREAEARAAGAEVARLEAALQAVRSGANAGAEELDRERLASGELRLAVKAHEDEAREAKREVVRLAKELAQSQARTEAGARELERARTRTLQLDAAAEARAEAERAEKRESARIEKELQASLVSLEAKKREIERRNARVAVLEGQLAERDERIKTLAPPIRSKTARGVLRPQPPPKRVTRTASDDLKRIAGIGPVLAEKLRRLGVATFDELAAMTRSDIEMLAEKLGIAADRIRREGWITAARVEARSRGGS